MYNTAILQGYLGRDVEVSHMRNGDKVANLSVATSETWKDKESDEWKERTEWHRVVTFQQGLIEFLERRAQKGVLVLVQGSLRTRSYTKEGESSPRYVTEILLSRNGVIRFPNKAAEGDDGNDNAGSDEGKGHPGPNLDDEIPF